MKISYLKMFKNQHCIINMWMIFLCYLVTNRRLLSFLINSSHCTCPLGLLWRRRLIALYPFRKFLLKDLFLPLCIVNLFSALHMDWKLLVPKSRKTWYIHWYIILLCFHPQKSCRRSCTRVFWTMAIWKMSLCRSLHVKFLNLILFLCMNLTNVPFI